MWELATRQRPYGEYTEVEPFCRAGIIYICFYFIEVYIILAYNMKLNSLLIFVLVCFEHVRPPLIPELPHDLKLLMAACWQNDPNLRPSFRDIERRY